ncbi:MAG: glycosyltransferase [Candidatus Chisholmbacteria bacterium]|nr:glycosyltransferase [Candidatus Chisholmbacteria bacterium]
MMHTFPKSMKHLHPKQILFVTTDYSYFTSPVTSALQKLGFEVTVFDYYKPNFLSRFIGLAGTLGLASPKSAGHKVARLMNQALIHLVSKLKPKYLLVIKGETITPKTIDTINNLEVTTINWFGDGLFYWRWMKKTASHYSFFINNGLDSYKQLAKFGVKNYYLEYAAPHFDLKEKVKKIYPLTFVGQHTLRRERYFKGLKDLGLKIWGYAQWQQSSLKDIASGPVSVTEAHHIIRQSHIVVNLLTGTIKTQPEEINIRTLETLGLKTFLLVQDYPHLHRYFKVGQELITFKNPQDLRRKALYYLKHNREREAIAAAGYRRILRDHTFAKRLKDLFKIVNRKSK